jgi:hypothetical protein
METFDDIFAFLEDGEILDAFEVMANAFEDCEFDLETLHEKQRSCLFGRTCP